MRKYEDSHHIIHHSKEWSLRADARSLRETHSLIPRIDRSLHEEIHRKCPAIPLLGYHALNRTLNAFHPTNNTLETMDNLMSAIEVAANNHKAHPVEKSLAELAIIAIDLQKPYIKEGLHESR